MLRSCSQLPARSTHNLLPSSECPFVPSAMPLSEALENTNLQESRKRSAPDAIPSSPRTPEVVHESTPSSNLRAVHWLSAVYTNLQQGLHNLRALHPACCFIPAESSHLALGIFRQYAALTALSYQYSVSQPLIAKAVEGVCLWTSIKFLANPGVVPNSRFVASAMGVSPNLLISFEPEVLRAVNWDLLGICKAIGLAPPQPADDSEEEGASP